MSPQTASAPQFSHFRRKLETGQEHLALECLPWATMAGFTASTHPASHPAKHSGVFTLPLHPVGHQSLPPLPRLASLMLHIPALPSLRPLKARLPSSPSPPCRTPCSSSLPRSLPQVQPARSGFPGPVSVHCFFWITSIAFIYSTKPDLVPWVYARDCQAQRIPQ